MQWSDPYDFNFLDPDPPFLDGSGSGSGSFKTMKIFIYFNFVPKIL